MQSIPNSKYSAHWFMQHIAQDFLSLIPCCFTMPDTCIFTYYFRKYSFEAVGKRRRGNCIFNIQNYSVALLLMLLL